VADFLMPALGADMEKGTLVQWRVEPGSRVKSGDVVAVVETQKGAIDVEIFLDGVIQDLVPVGTQRLVGDVLARVRQAEAAVARPAPATPMQPSTHERPAASAAIATAPAAAPSPAALAPTPARARISPAARVRAGELGIDASSLAGSGPEGAVAVRDVEAAAAARTGPAAQGAKATAAAPAGFDTAQMRAAIAAAMSRSKREIPHYYLLQAVDFGACQEWLANYNADRAPAQRLLPAVLLLKATARALTAVPQLNGFHQDGAVRLAPDIHAGWAVALRGGGLIAPAIHHADRQSLADLMLAMRDLVQRARAGGLRSSELSDATVTITNLGDRGADSVQGIVVPPQLALVGFGRVALRPWVVDERVLPRPVVQVSLAADHRASDGHVGGLLLAAIDEALQHPERL
jgi:pyruvate dehydrogenase E2 component (dihydrolipoamide acetyltransferase)